MITRLHKNDGSVLPQDSVALVASRCGELRLFPPADKEMDFSASQLFLSAIAVRATDPDWVKEQIDFLMEVDRALDAQSNDEEQKLK